MRIIVAVSLVFILGGCIGTPEVIVAPEIKAPPLTEVSWDSIEGWQLDRPLAAFETFRRSCRALSKRKQWRQVCSIAKDIKAENDAAARRYFERYFSPWQVQNEDGTTQGTITGYYGPELDGSLVKTEKYQYPLYGQPDDLLIVDLDNVYPELNDYRLRGRLVGNRVVPYFERSEINGTTNPLAGTELFWLADPVELFFLHIQGSGLIRLPSGEQVMVGYANQNGHPFRSIGKLLLEQKAMTREQMSKDNISNWVKQNPELGEKLLAENPRYVFFHTLKPDIKSPLGALGIPLTALRSLAVDPRTVPLGAPVFLDTTFPGKELPLRQLMVAQDVGGAIKGRVRADFFWGMGDDAGKIAGKMKQNCSLWVLLPKNSRN